MPVPFIVIEKTNPRNPGEPRKYYAHAKSNGAVDLRTLANQIAAISTLSTPDVLAALEALLLVIPQHLADGMIVRLGELGSFSLSVQSAASDSREEVSARNITSNRLRFRPGKLLREKLGKVSYEKKE